MSIVNPLLWEIGHVAWFQEKWVLRHTLGQMPLRPDVDQLYDSMAIPHGVRWDLPLPSLEETLSYMREVRDRVLDRLAQGNLDEELVYFVKLAVFHEDMHTEAFTYTRQTHQYPPPRLTASSSSRPPSAAPAGGKADAGGDVQIPGGTFQLGASPGEPFVLDNEKWAHPVQLRPFAISRTAVRQAEFAAFVEEGGYLRPEFWSEQGWEWRNETGAEQPVYWRREAKGEFSRRDFDRWVPLEPERAVIQLSWHEAQAYCRWAGRRLPSEAEWEVAASASINLDGPGLSTEKRLYPWGDDTPTPSRANLDWQSMGTIDVSALPEGDSALGCRQMIGNVWEWTSDDFLPYPGFVPDPYKDYSEPWFRTRKVLRGGCWATRSRLLRNTWRNFYEPHRRDVWAGFRTCSLES